MMDQILDELRKELPDLFTISHRLEIQKAVELYIEEYKQLGSKIPQYKGTKQSRTFKRIIRKYVKPNYKIKTPEQIAKSTEARKRAVKKYQQKPTSKIAHALRRRLWQALKGGRKEASTIELLGCSFEQLKVHLESQFTEGMTWDNYGEWHIDHIRPLASFNLTNSDELKIAANYQNLQPMWGLDNIKKGAKW